MRSFCIDLPTSTCTSASKCGHTYTYGDTSSTQVVLATETFTLGKTKLHSVAFGCGDTNEGEEFSQGVGLVGRGPFSLVSQLGLEKFTYCLTSLEDTSKSMLLLGSVADISESAATAPVQTTRLVKNPSQPSFYYVTLTGLTVMSTHITLPSSAFVTGTGGVIVDSGTSITYVPGGAGLPHAEEGVCNADGANGEQVRSPVAGGSRGGDLIVALLCSALEQVDGDLLGTHSPTGSWDEKELLPKAAARMRMFQYSSLRDLWSL
ncbi:aspartic proteinase nepenthesin-2-like [Phragmites australis]|uniref:aspartic proteinase nepenthesin-2-like n=1 Tax=Phragmites australis TaxID=29695 RepID=UPI002D786416|nr:aspartic proteinase nepenthesin-2-like [Phragmites australis]